MPSVTGWVSRDPRNEATAKTILEVLHGAYPGYSWFVRIDGGVLVIYNYQIDGRHGMIRHLKDIASDHTTLSKDILRAAGELLERARLRRARAIDGRQAESVDGIAPSKRRLM